MGYFLHTAILCSFSLLYPQFWCFAEQETNSVQKKIPPILALTDSDIRLLQPNTENDLLLVNMTILTTRLKGVPNSIGYFYRDRLIYWIDDEGLRFKRMFGPIVSYKNSTNFS